jgi:hypothetical protein
VSSQPPAVAVHIPGTLYPLGGKPHLPTMCAFRTGIRRNHRSVTVLCYEHGVWETVGADGKGSIIRTAEGDMPYRVCEKHFKQWMRSYRGASFRNVETGAAL